MRRPESGRDWSDAIAFPAAYSSSAVADTLILLKFRFFTLEVPFERPFRDSRGNAIMRWSEFYGMDLVLKVKNREVLWLKIFLE